MRQLRVYGLVPALVLCLLCGGTVLQAQQGEPGTGSPGFTAASRAQGPVHHSDAGLDSTPGSALDSNIDLSVDSGYQPESLGLGGRLDMQLGPDDIPPTPPGMIARSTPGNPAMVYFALPHRSGSDILPADAAIIDSRQRDLVRAAAFRGFDLKQNGWMYQQGICPAMQPDAQALTDMPAADSGEGSILLHFVRREDGRVSAFTAIVPRGEGQPVRTIGIAHRSVEEHDRFLSADTTGAVVNQAIPPATLYGNLQPLNDWIATSACIAEMGGAYPHIPNEPSLSAEIITAPGPYLRLGLNGEREILFTDRVDRKNYVVWDERVSRTGKMLGAHRDQVAVVSRPITNPRIPAPKFTGDGRQPPSTVEPYPPSPAFGARQ